MDTLWVYHVCINTVVPPRPPPPNTHTVLPGIRVQQTQQHIVIYTVHAESSLYFVINTTLGELDLEANSTNIMSLNLN